VVRFLCVVVLAALVSIAGGKSSSGGLPASVGGVAQRPTGVLAFESYDEQAEIVTMRPDGTGLRVLVPNASEPAWSPDGRWLAYTAQPGQIGYPSIWRVRASGANARKVSRFKVKIPGTPIASAPSWSPDGRRVLFTAQYELPDSEGSAEDGGPLTELGVFVARRDGSRPRKLRGATGFTGPAWSPDGRRIAVVTRRGDIGIMDANGRRLRVVYHGRDLHSKLQFSPDGRHLLAIVGFGPPTINTLDIRTGRRTKIAPSEGERLTAATWTPNGKRIGYMASLGWTRKGGLPPGSPTVLFTVRPDGTGKQRLSTVPVYVQGDTLTWKAAS
jgi:Tol biopolymer transport system component